MMTRLLRRSFLPALCVFCVLAAGGGAFAAVAPKITDIKQPKNVLMVGNSFFYYNNSMHGHTRLLIDSAFPGQDRVVFLRLMAISAGALREHESGLGQMVKSGLKSGTWDVVILQGQSREPINPKTSGEFTTYAKKYAAMLKADGIQPAFFMTWAYADKPEMADELAEAYTRIANETGSIVIPAGLAFKNALAKKPDLVLHAPDKQHPSLAGTYLGACTIFSTFLKKSPEGMPYTAGLDAGTAAFLQKTAWETSKAFFGW